MRERVRAALDEIPAARRRGAQVIFTAHSIPMSMAAGCAYETAQMMVRDARCCDRGWVRRYSASAAQLAMLSQVLEMGPSASATVH